jgi:DNA uptake protein ComE-like DNA-binding protein
VRLDPIFFFVVDVTLRMKPRIVAAMIVGTLVLGGLALGLSQREEGAVLARADDVEHQAQPGQSKLDINAAPAQLLDQQLGIGRDVAERIVRLRPYRKLDDLITRRVLGRKQFARIKHRIHVGPPAVGGGAQ